MPQISTMEKEIIKTITYHLNEIDGVGNLIITNCISSKIWCFHGELGTGKTTLIRTLVKLLGGNPNEVSSPSYTLLNVYSFPENEIYHFDLYRIRGEDELESLGFFEYLYSSHYVWIEWPEKAEKWIQTPHYWIEIQFCKNNPLSRILTIFYINV